ncbi:arsenic resistance protein [Zafaria sp. Z1313]|uniref:arsenic resistance protein n=1 Tax=unclassified Zafaria TaxID=2828765 RepID=UPI002E75ECF2|nr:arsenic resistance protein [Zafaria sp. J156]MEE1622581.1 arsenic resistance protein [Zafaria sp. J156]
MPFPGTELLERRQVPVYLAAIAFAAAAGAVWPGLAALDAVVLPLLGLLMFATFLGVPLTRWRAGVVDRRFLAVVLVLNFAVAPLLAWGLSRFVAGERQLLVGVLLVLLTPCIDYVVAFTRLAGGAASKLLAATPLLMLLQMLLLPVYLPLMAGPGVLAGIDPRPFLEAFVLLILLPLGAAAALQALGARGRTGAGVARAAGSSAAACMVPLMAAVLAVVVASQSAAVAHRWSELLPLVPLYAGFAALMAAAGIAAGRLARLEEPGIRAASFTGATRNSLVVLPLALALPAGFELVPLVVVTQTLVELLAMVVMTGVVPRLVRSTPSPAAASGNKPGDNGVDP